MPDGGVFFFFFGLLRLPNDRSVVSRAYKRNLDHLSKIVILPFASYCYFSVLSPVFEQENSDEPF